MSKWLSTALLVSGVLALVVAGSLGRGLWGVDKPNPAQLELFKSALQALVVVVMGNLISLLVQSSIKDRDRAANTLELRKNASRRLIRSYMAAKKIRRQLRAGSDVRLLFDRLNDVQLTLESMKKEVKLAPVFVQGHAIVSGLRSMEKYLGKIIKQCERHMPDSEAFFPFNGRNLTWLADFTGPYKGSCFQARFVHSFDVVLALMQPEILAGEAKLPSRGEGEQEQEEDEATQGEKESGN